MRKIASRISVLFTEVYRYYDITPDYNAKLEELLSITCPHIISTTTEMRISINRASDAGRGNSSRSSWHVVARLALELHVGDTAYRGNFCLKS